MRLAQLHAMATKKRSRRANGLYGLDPVDKDSGCTLVVIETPRGCRTKVAYDPERGAFVVKKVLPQGMTFPFDFGFIPSTLGGDDDPLDVLVLMDEPITTGCVVPTRLIGVVEAVESEENGKSEKNDRLIGVADACELFKDVDDLKDSPDTVVEQIEHFFVGYKREEGDDMRSLGREGPERAEKLFRKGQRRYSRKQGKK
jgi:inorganic pyrophosphatase